MYLLIRGQRLRLRLALVLSLILVSVLVAPLLTDAQDGTPPAPEVPTVAPPPPTEVPPPPTEVPPPPTEVPPPPTEVPPPPPPPTDVPTQVPTEVPPTEVPPTAIPTVVTTPTPANTPTPEPTEEPSPTPIPDPSVTCKREGEDGPLQAGNVAEYRCEFTNGPVKPVIHDLEQGWELSLTGRDNTWVDRTDADLDETMSENGTLRLFIRPKDDAKPGLAKIEVDFRAGDFGTDAPQDRITLTLSLLAPTPTPTPEPAIAFEPVVECSPAGTVGTGSDAWSLQDCTATWKTEHMVTVSVTATSSDSSWQVVTAEPGALTATTLNAGTNSLALKDGDKNDDGFYSAEFAVGTKMVACSTSESVPVSLQLKATSHQPVPEDEQGDPLVDIATSPKVTETGNQSLTIDVEAATAPNVEMISASFTPIQYDLGERTSTGTIQFRFDGAHQSCNWRITLDIGDFPGEMADADLQVRSVNGLEAHISRNDTGEILITPNGENVPESGVITVTTTLTLDGFKLQGEYPTIIAVRSELLP